MNDRKIEQEAEKESKEKEQSEEELKSKEKMEPMNEHTSNFRRMT